jgi:hypothetical protein
MMTLPLRLTHAATLLLPTVHLAILPVSLFRCQVFVVKKCPDPEVALATGSSARHV